MALPKWAMSERNIELSGVITLTSGVHVYVQNDNIVSYTVNDSTSSVGFNIGGTSSASFRLSFYNPDKQYNPSQFDNAEVHMQMRVNGDTWEDFGVWYVESSDCAEQSVVMNLSGADALKTRFEAKYVDKSSYPQTFATMLTTVSMLATGVAPARNNFPNAALRKLKKPAWGSDCTLRNVVSYIAACAGGFAHINRSGRLDIISFTEGTRWDLTPDYYQEFSLSGGEAFKLNCLQIKLGNSDEFTRFVIDRSIEDNPTNCIQIEGNPLITELVGNTLINSFASLPAYEAASVTWGGDPAILPGDTLTVTDLNGASHILRVLNQSYTFNGGFRCTESCELPAVTQSGDGYTTGGRIFDANGNIKATHISGLDNSIVNATYAHFDSLDAETVTTDTLLASYIEALTLKARTIKAAEIETDSLTAMTAEIVNATIRKLKAGTIETDELNTALAVITAAQIDKLKAGSIETDELAAALAKFTVITAGNATFDRATIQHLLASALIVENAVGENVTIKNLSVDYANIVAAYVGNLVVRADDGRYYRLTVDSNGSVRPVEYLPSETETDIGQTEDGKPILDAGLSLEDLSPTTVKGTYSLVNKLDAARIDVDQLFAGTAFIERLNTTDITSNSYIRLSLNNLENDIADVDGWRKDMQRWIKFDQDGLTQGKEGSVYSTFIDETGYHIKRSDKPEYIGSFAKEGLTTGAVTLGNIVAKKTTKGGWAWTEADD